MLQDLSPLALCEALRPHGLAPSFRVAWTGTEAANAAKALGMPVVVRPAARNATAGTRWIEHVEDVPLAFSIAQRTIQGAVLIESACDGPRYCVCGTFDGERILRTSIVGRVRSEPPYCFDWCLYAPAPVTDAVRGQLVTAAETLCRATQWNGGFCADTVVSERGPLVLGLYPSDLLTPWLGDTKDIAPGGMAVAWIRPRTGVVTGVAGIQAACEMPGVDKVHVGITPGETIGHSSDEQTRDRIGYVRVVAETGEAALEIARRACACVRIETRPTVE